MEQLSLFTWKEMKESINKEEAIVFVTMAPIEQHSLCLPLGTDLIEGEYWCKKTMIKLEGNSNCKCYYLPSFPIACATVSNFYGCINFSMKTTYVVDKELLENLVCMGFRNIIIVASHGDPVHQIAIEKAVEKVNKHYGVCAISPMGAFFSLDELKIKHNTPQSLIDLEKRYPNDFHAGWVEISSMLAINNKLVRDGYNGLPILNISDRDMISSKRQFKTMGKYGHIGNPTIAKEEVGEMLNEDISEFMYEAVRCFVDRVNYSQYMQHILYRIPFFYLKLRKRDSWKKVIL